jgi:nicotinamidase-related amidase
MEDYTATLAKLNRFKVTIWPDHCIEGTTGHEIVKDVKNVLELWTRRTNKEVHYIKKGMNIYTEMYSALAAEVVDPEDPRTALNRGVINQLRSADRVSLKWIFFHI